MGKIAEGVKKINFTMLHGNYCYIFIENFRHRFFPCTVTDHEKNSNTIARLIVRFEYTWYFCTLNFLLILGNIHVNALTRARSRYWNSWTSFWIITHEYTRVRVSGYNEDWGNKKNWRNTSAEVGRTEIPGEEISRFTRMYVYNVLIYVYIVVYICAVMY